MRQALTLAFTLCVLLPAPALPDESPEIVGVIGSGSHLPSGVALDDSGNVYVAELASHRVRKFEPGGQLLARWTGWEESGPFNQPSDIVVDHDGRVWVADRANHRVVWFTTEGEYLGTFGGERTELSTPNGLGLHPEKDLLYVADTFNGRIRVLDISGVDVSVVADYGSPGTEPGELFRPTDIAISSDGEIYVIEPQLYRFQIFSASGRFLVAKGGPGTETGRFGLPVGIALDRNDDIYVVDSFNGRIQKFFRNLDFVCVWGRTPGQPIGPLNTPLRMAITHEGLAYICDTPNNNLANRIVVYQLNLPPPVAVEQRTWSEMRALYRR